MRILFSWEGEHKDGATTGSALDPDAASVSLDDGLDEVKTKAGALGAAVQTSLDAVEAVKDTILLLGRDTDALVSDVDGDAGPIDAAAHPHRATLG